MWSPGVGLDWARVGCVERVLCGWCLCCTVCLVVHMAVSAPYSTCVLVFLKLCQVDSLGSAALRVLQHLGWSLPGMHLALTAGVLTVMTVTTRLGPTDAAV
jgi:hypothetical protein